MGLFDVFKKKEQPPRTLNKEDISVVGVNYYEQNIKKLAVCNPEWRNTCKTIEKNGNIGKKIFRYNFINKPVKLVPEPQNKHDKNAIQVIIAGELVGYIPAELCIHVKNILTRHEIKYISAFISGGDYKVISQNSEISKDKQGISITIRIAYI